MPTLYQQAKRKVAQSIARGDYPVGGFLPPVEELAPQLEHTEATVRKALLQLADENVVRRIQRKGTQVVRMPRMGRVAMLLAPDAHLNGLVGEPIYTQLSRAGYDVEMIPATPHDEVLAEHCTRLRTGNSRTDYLVALEPPEHGDAAYWQTVEQFPYRVYFALSPNSLDTGGHWISMNHTDTAREVVDHLLSLGHRRIAAPVPGNGGWEDEVGATTRHLVEIAGGEFVPTTFLETNLGDVEPLLIKQGVTAYWGIHDYEALLVTNQLLRFGLHVPEHVSVVGRNDTPWGKECVSPLTTVSLNPPSIAKAVADAVVALTEDAEPVRGGTTLVQTRLIVRDSTSQVRDKPTVGSKLASVRD